MRKLRGFLLLVFVLMLSTSTVSADPFTPSRQPEPPKPSEPIVIDTVQPVLWEMLCVIFQGASTGYCGGDPVNRSDPMGLKWHYDKDGMNPVWHDDGDGPTPLYAPYSEAKLGTLKAAVSTWESIWGGPNDRMYIHAQLMNNEYYAKYAGIGVDPHDILQPSTTASIVTRVAEGTGDAAYATGNVATGGVPMLLSNTADAIATGDPDQARVILWGGVKNQGAMIVLQGGTSLALTGKTGVTALDRAYFSESVAPVQIVDMGNLGKQKPVLFPESVQMNLAGGMQVPGSLITNTSRMLPGPTQLQLNYSSGSTFQAQVQAALRIQQNTTEVIGVVSGKPVATIPDIFDATMPSRLGVGEIKNEARLYLSSQFRAQGDVANSIGGPHVLIVGPATKTISVPLQNAISSTGGTIFYFDPVTRTFKPVTFGPRLNQVQK